MTIIRTGISTTKWLAGASALLCALMTGCGKHSDSGSAPGKPGAVVLRIGYQKQGAMNLLRLRGDLEKKLAPQGVSVQWLNFPAGPQLMEGIGANSVDIGSVGDTPCIFAQAANNPFVYIANTPPGKRETVGFLVAKDSLIRSSRDLKGKKVAFQLGSGSTYWLVQALEHAGLSYKDIHPVNLSPPDAMAAFSSGALDAWTTWDPYVTIAQRQTGARLLTDDTQEVTAGGFYIARRAFAVEHPDLIKIALEETKRTSNWSVQHPHEAAAILAPNLGLDVASEEEIIRRGTTTNYHAIDADVLALQQREADTFFKMGLIPRHLDVRENALTPQQYALLQPSLQASIE